MKLFHELVEELESTRSSAEKKHILLNNNGRTLRIVLQHMFDKNIKLGIKKIPDWTPADDPEELSLSNFGLEAKKLYLLYENNVAKIGQHKTERIVVRMLESIHADDAKILEKLIMGKLKISGITERLVRETFPDLLGATE
jgi:hypothetical protein